MTGQEGLILRALPRREIGIVEIASEQAAELVVVEQRVLAVRGAVGGTDAEAQKLAEDFRDMVAKVIPERKAVIAANEEMTRDYRPDADEARVLLPGDLMQFELFQ